MWKAKAKRRPIKKKEVVVLRQKLDKMKALFDRRDGIEAQNAGASPLDIRNQVFDPVNLSRFAMITGAVEKMVPIYQLPPLPAVKLPARKKGPGKPKLTDEVATMICRALERGAFRETACSWAGVSESNFIRWLKMQGEPYETFRQAVERAEAHAELNMINAIQVGAYTQDAKHAVTFLQMRWRKRWTPPAGPNVPGTTVNFNFATLLDQAERAEGYEIKKRRDRYLAEDRGEVVEGEVVKGADALESEIAKDAQGG